MAVLQVRIDDLLKLEATAVFNEIGVDLSTAIRVFLKKAVMVGGFPFETNLDESTLKFVLAVKHMQETSENNGNSNMTLDEINEEIKKAREKRRERKK